MARRRARFIVRTWACQRGLGFVLVIRTPCRCRAIFVSHFANSDFLYFSWFCGICFLEIHFPSFHLVFFSHTTPSNFHMQHNHYNTLSVGTSKLSLDEKKEFHCTFTLLKNACTHTLNRERILLCDFTLYIYWGEQNNRSSYVEGLACTDWLWKKKKKEKRNFYLRTHFHRGRKRESNIGWARSYFIFYWEY